MLNNDELATALPHGGVLWSSLERLSALSNGMLQLEFAIARRSANPDPPQLDADN